MVDQNGSCIVQEVLGAFPVINGMNCTDYALYIGGLGIVAAFLFWQQVTK